MQFFSLVLKEIIDEADLNFAFFSDFRLNAGPFAALNWIVLDVVCYSK